MKSSYPDGYRLISGVFHPVSQSGADTFAYSDGEQFESDIAEVVSKATDRSLFSRELIDAIWDWRSSCHLSPGRANLLRPLERSLRGRVLELGAGCGPITRYLGELGGQITALEASAFRADIARTRTSDLQNVSVVCDRIERFEPEVKFDAVTMIGVLQYARLFGLGGASAEKVILQAAARQMKPDGVLILAIQNKLGLKYLAGFPEANVGSPYFGIEDGYAQDTAIRFGLKELKALLSDVGLEHHAFLFPMPDYHMPAAILSAEAFDPSNGFNAAALLAATAGQDRVRPDWRRPQFSLERAWETLQANGLLADLANAFLVVAGRSSAALQAVPNDTLAWHYATVRHPGFCTSKSFHSQNGQVVVRTERMFNKPAPDVPMTHGLTHDSYHVGRLWWLELIALLNRPGWDATAISLWAKPWIDLLVESTGSGVFSEATFDRPIDGRFFDATPSNLIKDDVGQLRFFDQEWLVRSPVSLGYIAFRGLLGSLSMISSCATPAAGTPLVICDLIRQVLLSFGVNLSEIDRDRFLSQEIRIQRWAVSGSDDLGEDAASKHLRHFLSVKLDQRPTQTFAEIQALLANKELQLAEYKAALSSANAQINALHAALASSTPNK